MTKNNRDERHRLVSYYIVPLYDYLPFDNTTLSLALISKYFPDFYYRGMQSHSRSYMAVMVKRKDPKMYASGMTSTKMGGSNIAASFLCHLQRIRYHSNNFYKKTTSLY